MDPKKFHKPFQNIVATTFSGEKPLPEGTYDFSIGDPDFSTDETIIRYAFAKTLEEETHYGVPSGKKELKEAIVDFHNSRLGQNISINNVQITSSASHAMFLAMKALLDPGDEVILFAPYFANYFDQITLNEGVPVIVNTHYENSFELVEEEIEAKITPKTKAIIFNNPANPSGHLYSHKSLEILRRVAIRHDLIVCCDDIYTTYIYNGEVFETLANLPDMASRCIQVRSFSKDSIMTGWRIGYLVADKELIDVTKAINESIVYSPSVISQNAAIAALANFDEIAKRVQNVYRIRLQTAFEEIQKSPYFDCLAIEGTFYIFMNIEKTGLSDKEFASYVLENAHVKVFPGSLFGGEEYSRFVRLAINMGEKRIREAFAALNALTYPGK
ncbi:MAG: aminotransferase class I/II-fold pyridoxal phosphate-dependent enzyme [Candidatus Enteromonas sp.]|nr:aminotransferase class I/II-fold pyridoxal phosphate-dependent enzyme [Candidatus Enteromonas sp.]